jgi:predicted lipoprotein with Yx(FWY)xxD motif
MKRKPSIVLLAALLLSGLVVSGTAVGGRMATSPAVVKVAFNKKLKKSILVDSRGFTLYVFGLDTSGKPTLGVVKNPEGGVQVTYSGHPIYYFRGGPGWGAGDKKPGDVNGRSIAAWHVISPTGAVIFL